MKILHIDETFHPHYGYHTSILTRNEALNESNEIYILTVDHKKLYPVYKDFNDYEYDLANDRAFEKKNLHIVRCGVYRYISNRAIYVGKIFKIIDKIKPDIIYCHLLESYIAIRLLLRKSKYPIIFDSHMLQMASKNKFSKWFNFFFRKIVTPKIVKNKYKIIKTQNDPYLTDVLGIPENLIEFISFGTDIDLFHSDANIKSVMRKKYNIGQEDFVVLYTGKLTEDKGGTFYSQVLSKKFNLVNERNIVFVIVGFITEELKDKFKQSQNRIIFVERQKYIDLPKFYQFADLSVFPKQCSLSFYDAQSCGLPVVSENNLVNSERLEYNNGLTFKPGDVDDFRSKILFFANMSKEDIEIYAENAINFVQKSYSYKKIVQQYNDIYLNEIKRFKEKIGG